MNFNGEDPAVGTSPDDMLSVVGGTFTSVVNDFTVPAVGAAHKGTITYTTAALGSDVITYTGVGTSTVNMAATDDTDPGTPAGQPGRSVISSLTFNLPGAGDAAILEDDGTPGNTVSQLRSTAGTPTFANTLFPAATTVTVNMGSDGGAFTVGSLPDFGNTLAINGQAGADTVTFTGTASLTALTVNVDGSITNAANASLNVTGDANFTAGSIDLGNQTPVTASGSVTMTATQNILLQPGSSITVHGGGLHGRDHATGQRGGDGDGELRGHRAERCGRDHQRGLHPTWKATVGPRGAATTACGCTTEA